MKMSQLKMAIREVVREEIRLGLKEIIGGLKQPSLSSKPKKKIEEKKDYSNNQVLNEILKETAHEEEWKTLGDGEYDSSRMGEVLQSSYGDMMSDNPNGTLASEMGVNPVEAPDFLKKDYRKLMKAVDKKRG